MFSHSYCKAAADRCWKLEVDSHGRNETCNTLVRLIWVEILEFYAEAVRFMKEITWWLPEPADWGIEWPRKSLHFQYSVFLFQMSGIMVFSCWIVYSSARLRSLLNTTTTIAACDFQLKTDFQGCQSLKNYLFWGIFLKQPWWCLVRRWILHSRIEQNRAGSESFQSWIQAESNPATTDFIALTDHNFYLEVKETTDFWWRVLRSLIVGDPN